MEDKEIIKATADKLALGEELVFACIEHLRELSINKAKRDCDKAKKEEKITAKYEDYSWYELVMSGKLNGLLVLELDKYLTKHNLNTNCSKIDKVREITADVLRKQSKGKQQGKIGSTSEKCKAVVHKLDSRVDSECSDNDSDSDDEDSDDDDLVF